MCYSVLLWAVLGCAGMYLAVLGCTVLYWSILDLTGLHLDLIGWGGHSSGGSGGPVIQVIKVVQVVQVVRMISIDDMHSENMWYGLNHQSIEKGEMSCL